MNSQPDTADHRKKSPEDVKTYYCIVKGFWPVSLRIDKNEAIISRILNISLKYGTKSSSLRTSITKDGHKTGGKF